MMRRIDAIACGVLLACGEGSPRLGGDAALDGARLDAPLDVRGDTSLILHYEFEGTTTVVPDSASRGKTGTLNDAAAWTADGRIGRGVDLTGGLPAARYVSLPDGVLSGVDDFTIAVWVKARTVSNWARVYDIGNGPLNAGGTSWMFLTLHGFVGTAPVTDTGIHASSFGGTDNEIIAASTTQFPTGVWKHLAVTGSGGDRTLYVDGFPVTHVTSTKQVLPRDMEPIGRASWLGRSRFESLGDAGLDGTLDDFRIYDRALSPSEVSDLAWPQRDYSYWRFDDASGMTAKDSSDNAIPTVLRPGLGWTTGRLGGALDFPGGAAGPNGAYAQLATAPLARCTTQLTVATWVKLHSQDSWARVFDFGTGTPATTFIYLTLYDDRDGANGARAHGMHFAMVSPNGAFDLFTATPPVAADNTWHHVAVTVDAGALVTMYVDGAVVTSLPNTTNVRPADFAATTDNYLGKSQFEATDSYLHAALDDLRIACRAFTADEIKSLARP